MRAKSISHAEYEILSHLLGEIELQYLRDEMCDDAHSTKRFDTAAKNICKMLTEKAMVRIKSLPKDHPERIKAGA
tara:strand:+ start:341 stop:565 length:225 start_codon:yes stop_codon:yes gene_type:complete